jgi:hypothetical protein
MSVFRQSGNTVAIASTSGGANQSFSLSGSGDVLRVVNPSNLDAFIKTGVGSQTATSSDVLVRAGTEILIQIDFADDSVGVITPSTPSGLYVARGSAR